VRLTVLLIYENDGIGQLPFLDRWFAMEAQTVTRRHRRT